MMIATAGAYSSADILTDTAAEYSSAPTRCRVDGAAARGLLGGCVSARTSIQIAPYASAADTQSLNSRST